MTIFAPVAPPPIIAPPPVAPPLTTNPFVPILPFVPTVPVGNPNPASPFVPLQPIVPIPNSPIAPNLPIPTQPFIPNLPTPYSPNNPLNIPTPTAPFLPFMPNGSPPPQLLPPYQPVLPLLPNLPPPKPFIPNAPVPSPKSPLGIPAAPVLPPYPTGQPFVPSGQLCRVYRRLFFDNVLATQGYSTTLASPASWDYGAYGANGNDPDRRSWQLYANGTLTETFNSLRNIDRVDVTDIEVWDGTSWQPFTPAGTPAQPAIPTSNPNSFPLPANPNQLPIAPQRVPTPSIAPNVLPFATPANPNGLPLAQPIPINPNTAAPIVPYTPPPKLAPIPNTPLPNTITAPNTVSNPSQTRPSIAPITQPPTRQVGAPLPANLSFPNSSNGLPSITQPNTGIATTSGGTMPHTVPANWNGTTIQQGSGTITTTGTSTGSITTTSTGSIVPTTQTVGQPLTIPATQVGSQPIRIPYPVLPTPTAKFDCVELIECLEPVIQNNSLDCLELQDCLDSKINSLQVDIVNIPYGVCPDQDVRHITLAVRKGDYTLAKQRLMDESAALAIQACTPCYATIPSYSGVRIGADRPQAVILWREILANGKKGNYYTSTSIYFYNKGVGFKPSIPDYLHGNIQGEYRLNDGSRLIINGRSESEARKIIDTLKTFIDNSRKFSPEQVSYGKRMGQTFREVKLRAIRLDFYSKGQKDTKPDWSISLV